MTSFSYVNAFSLYWTPLLQHIVPWDHNDAPAFCFNPYVDDAHPLFFYGKSLPASRPTGRDPYQLLDVATLHRIYFVLENYLDVQRRRVAYEQSAFDRCIANASSQEPMVVCGVPGCQSLLGPLGTFRYSDDEHPWISHEAQASSGARCKHSTWYSAPQGAYACAGEHDPLHRSAALHTSCWKLGYPRLYCQNYRNNSPATAGYLWIPTSSSLELPLCRTPLIHPRSGTPSETQHRARFNCFVADQRTSVQLLNLARVQAVPQYMQQPVHKRVPVVYRNTSCPHFPFTLLQSGTSLSKVYKTLKNAGAGEPVFVTCSEGHVVGIGTSLTLIIPAFALVEIHLSAEVQLRCLGSHPLRSAAVSERILRDNGARFTLLNACSTGNPHYLVHQHQRRLYKKHTFQGSASHKRYSYLCATCGIPLETGTHHFLGTLTRHLNKDHSHLLRASLP